MSPPLPPGDPRQVRALEAAAGVLLSSHRDKITSRILAAYFSALRAEGVTFVAARGLVARDAVVEWLRTFAPTIKGATCAELLPRDFSGVCVCGGEDSDGRGDVLRCPVHGIDRGPA